MKKIILSLVLPLSISPLFAQKAPDAVQKAFAQKFPMVKKVSYDREKNGDYEAEFSVNGTETSANFTADGKWLETEKPITTTALPADVVKAINAKYPSAKIVGAAQIETLDKGTLYEADLKIGIKKQEILLDAKGNFVK
jgi:Putative beta-lactamase-inhibitor-like, PepSY-like